MARAVARSLLSLASSGVLRREGSLARYVCCRQISLSSKPIEPLTIIQARDLLMDMVGSMFDDPDAKLEPGDFLPIKNSQSECPVRSMADSYQEVIIPLGKDPGVRQKYLTSNQGLRFGRILEDLDTFAGVICYTHNQDPSFGKVMKSPLSTVTALVDRIDLHDVTISPFEDVRMRGHVTWVGTSSMEVTMIVEQEKAGKLQQMLTAKFVMVARNPDTKKAAVVNGLKATTDEEKAMFALGEESKNKRKEESQNSLLKTLPNADERMIVHNMFLDTIDQKSGSFKVRKLPENSVWMSKTLLKTLRICHPEQKNLYHKIFGGFLMRQAFELAWANAALYCQSRPVAKVVDDIIFHQPVEIGSLLFLSSQVVYTQGPLMQVKVHAEVVNPYNQQRHVTNNFYFAFDSIPSTESPETKEPLQVVPKTYAESMLFLDGMRHLKA